MLLPEERSVEDDRDWERVRRTRLRTYGGRSLGRVGYLGTVATCSR